MLQNTLQNSRPLTRSCNRRELLRAGLAIAAMPVWAAPAWAAAAKDFWDDKPSAEWSSSEIDRLLTKSPWAKDASISYNGGSGSTGNPTPRSRGGYPPGGYPGGGGIGFPGGGGGLGYPGRYPGGNYPQAGGYPGGDAGGAEHYTATVRWESAQPIQDALHADPKAGKPDPDLAKFYVIQVLGDLPDMGAPRMRRGGVDDDDADIGDREQDTQNERRLDMFRQYTRIDRKDGALSLEKVVQGSRTSSRGPGTLFYFSRSEDISLDDRLLTFMTKMGPVEIKARFTPKEMKYHGRLAV